MATEYKGECVKGYSYIIVNDDNDDKSPSQLQLQSQSQSHYQYQTSDNQECCDNTNVITSNVATNVVNASSAVNANTSSGVVKKLDNTEGFGAYDDLGLLPNTMNFDNGGCAYNNNTEYLKERYKVTNHVYDPYKRSQEENAKTLELVNKQIFDTCTSNSVLNVISCPVVRRQHIQLCFQALLENGTAYFKIWRGNKSCLASTERSGFQANQPPKFFMKEIETIFGKGNVTLVDDKNLLIAKKVL